MSPCSHGLVNKLLIFHITEKDDTVAIVAGTVGGVVGIALIALVIFALKKKGIA